MSCSLFMPRFSSFFFFFAAALLPEDECYSGSGNIPTTGTTKPILYIPLAWKDGDCKREAGAWLTSRGWVSYPYI